MEIRINKQWVIYTSKNGAGVILGKIPENKQDDVELDVNKLGGNNLHHYATVFGAVQGLFKYGVNDTEAKSFAELEAKIERIAQECQSAFIKSQSVQAVPEWISVKDNLPPENILVLGMSQTRSNIFNVYNVMALDEFEEAEVTHWMPLSDAPQEPAND